MGIQLHPIYNCFTSQDGYTLLGHAIISGSVEATEMLLQGVTDPKTSVKNENVSRFAGFAQPAECEIKGHTSKRRHPRLIKSYC